MSFLSVKVAYELALQVDGDIMSMMYISHSDLTSQRQV